MRLVMLFYIELELNQALAVHDVLFGGLNRFTEGAKAFQALFPHDYRTVTGSKQYNNLQFVNPSAGPNEDKPAWPEQGSEQIVFL